jgi:hypothetical protein
MAAMLLLGTEVAPTTENLEQMRADNPLITEQQKRFYEIMQETWDGIDMPADTLGLNDLSAETFRQELLDELAQHRNEYEQMPLGVFSGIGVKDESLLHPKDKTKTPYHVPGVVALLGYPKRPEGQRKHTYTEHHLLFGSDEPKTYKLNQVDILTFLRMHKGTGAATDRYVTPGLEQAERETVEQYKKWIKDWEKPKATQVHLTALESLFSPTATKDTITQTSEAESRIKVDEMDLIAWIEVNPASSAQ